MTCPSSRRKEDGIELHAHLMQMSFLPEIREATNKSIIDLPDKSIGLIVPSL
jgi:hypothetical protein